MLEIENSKCGGMTISDTPYRYERFEYVHLIDLLSTHWKPDEIMFIKASGVHLSRICEQFTNISRPRNIDGCRQGFIWYGDEARMIFANIALALRYDTTEVVETVSDYNFDWHKK